MCKSVVAVSACLLNIPCQYNGEIASVQLNAEEIRSLDEVLVPLCPEQLSGLSTPRKPVEIQGGTGEDALSGNARVVSEDGEDFTEQFVKGAMIVLEAMNIVGATKMITQRRSPSCSSNGIYDGSFCHKLRPGDGVCAALLRSKGIELIDIEIFKRERGLAVSPE